MVYTHNKVVPVMQIVIFNLQQILLHWQHCICVEKFQLIAIFLVVYNYVFNLL